MSRRKRITHETKASRRRKSFGMKFVVWIFIFVFGFSVVGGLFVLGASFFGGR